MEELDRIKKVVLDKITGNRGVLSDGEFDNEFKRIRQTEDGLVRSKNLAFAPIWFVCANTDKSHAFHIYAAQQLMEDGVLDHANGEYTVIDYNPMGDAICKDRIARGLDSRDV